MDLAPEKAHPATVESFQLPSHGAQLKSFVSIAAGATDHSYSDRRIMLETSILNWLVSL